MDARPVIVALAGPNGAGKTTFYESHLRPSGLRFLNADVFAHEIEMDPYRAAQLVANLRNELAAQKQSFIFETVFSDPIGDKLTFLKEASQAGFTVALCFIGISSPGRSDERVAMRVSQGGHDVPNEKLLPRFFRSLANLKRAIRELPHVLIFDNDDLQMPFRLVAIFRNGRQVTLNQPVPAWLKEII
ncbi:MAG TPA: zeta toxin family protein [Verrucomicrobiae bacterium]|jgi:predicted ABC-type ATPase|nr:zeta toxin family protein [Verrucomicrobiae bacterium]